MVRLLLANVFVSVLLLQASAVSAQCTAHRIAVIEREAKAIGVHSDYAVALARKLTNCSAHYMDNRNRIGVMGVRQSLLEQQQHCNVHALTDPVANIRAGLSIIRDLLAEYGDWETALNVYLGGHEDADQMTRALVRSVFSSAQFHACHHSHRQCTASFNALDDFGPRFTARVRPCRFGDGHWSPISQWQ